MLPPLYALLLASAPVAAIVSTRIYPHGDAPQGVAQPYVTWQMVSGVPEISLSDLPDIDRCTLQINCWHPTSAGVISLATAVRAAVESTGHVTGVGLQRVAVDQRETATRLYWIALQMDWFLPR